MVEIKLTNVTKRYQDAPVIQNLNLTLPSHQITALIGPSGSGKSTLLNLIAGLQAPTSGQIKFDARTVADPSQAVDVAPADRNLAMVFQDFALWPHMTVTNNVAFALEPRLEPAALTRRVHWALDQVGLVAYGDRYPSELSGGQQQRVALARALAVRPKLVLFDEALSALDPQLRASLQTEISQLIHENHLTAVFVTHDRQEALRIADNVVLIHEGQVIQTGPAQDLYQHPTSAFSAKFIGPLNELNDHAGIRPEHVQLAGNHQSGPTYDGQIISSTFVGAHFDTLVDVHGHPWHVNTPKFCDSVATKISVDAQHILKY